MPQNNSKMLIGALVAAVLAVAVYYGLISQQSATNIQTQTNQTLGTAPASQQSPAPAPAPQNAPAQPPASPDPSPQNPTPPIH